MLVTGSLYLLSELVACRGRRAAREHRPDDRPTCACCGLVALVVATVILVFFTVGYVLGRVLL